MPTLLKEHETVPAPQVIFSAILDPVFAIPGKPELYTSALLFRMGNETYQFIRFLGYHRCDPAFSPKIFETPVQGLTSMHEENLALIVIPNLGNHLVLLPHFNPKNSDGVCGPKLSLSQIAETGTH
jgi:hypothetical protein